MKGAAEERGGAVFGAVVGQVGAPLPMLLPLVTPPPRNPLKTLCSCVSAVCPRHPRHPHTPNPSPTVSPLLLVESPYVLHHLVVPGVIAMSHVESRNVHAIVSQHGQHLRVCVCKCVWVLSLCRRKGVGVVHCTHAAKQEEHGKS